VSVLSEKIERRLYTCPICGAKRIIEVKNSWRNNQARVAVCVHKDTQGGDMPIILHREEGVLLDD